MGSARESKTTLEDAICYKCGQKRHYAGDYYNVRLKTKIGKRNETKKNESRGTRTRVAFAQITPYKSESSSLIIGSRASKHIVKDKDMFEYLETVPSITIELAAGTKVSIVRKRSCAVKADGK